MKIFNRFLPFGVILILFFAIPHIAYNQSAGSTKVSAFSYLTKREGNIISLSFDKDALIQNKKTNQYMPATITSADGLDMSAEIRARGKYRRKFCSIPPVKIKFPKKMLRQMNLDTLNEVRLALPCAESEEGQGLLLREYIAYRMYELVNPTMSVRARLVKINLKDIGHPEAQVSQTYGMLMEHEEELSARLGGHIDELYNTPTDSLNAQYAADQAMFEYLIGNTDWEVLSSRNVHLFRSFAGGKLVPIPYDFDFSGFVNASYAVPPSNLALTSVRDRVLIADSILMPDIKESVLRLKAKKDDLLALCKNPLLDESSQEWLTIYTEDFFNALDEQKILPVRLKNVER